MTSVERAGGVTVGPPSDAPATFLFADIAGFTVWKAARLFSPTRARCCREGEPTSSVAIFRGLDVHQ